MPLLASHAFKLRRIAAGERVMFARVELIAAAKKMALLKAKFK